MLTTGTDTNRMQKIVSDFTLLMIFLDIEPLIVAVVFFFFHTLQTFCFICFEFLHATNVPTKGLLHS